MYIWTFLLTPHFDSGGIYFHHENRTSHRPLDVFRWKMNTLYVLSFVDHIAEEQRDQESSLFNRDVSDTQSMTTDKGTRQEAVSPGINNELHSMS